MPADDVARIIALVRKIGPLPAWPGVSPSVLVKAMGSDKKTRRGVLRFVLSPRIGRARTHDDVPVDAVERVLHFTPLLVAATSTRLGASK